MGCAHHGREAAATGEKNRWTTIEQLSNDYWVTIEKPLNPDRIAIEYRPNGKAPPGTIKHDEARAVRLGEVSSPRLPRG